ncbi:hypothetical protein V8E36_003075 [Tilletia maclaganii]
MQRLEKALKVLQTMRDIGLTVSELFEEMLTSREDAFVRFRRGWLVYRSDRSYGPMQLIERVMQTIEAEASKEASLSLYDALGQMLSKPVEQEMRVAAQSKTLTSSSLLTDQTALEKDQVQATYDIFTRLLPLSTSLAGILCGPRAYPRAAGSGGPISDAVSIEDKPSNEAAKSGSRAVSVILSVALNLRSKRLNRLQAAIGLLLRFQRAQISTHTMLNHLFLSSSRDTSTEHLRAVKDAAVLAAQRMMSDHSRVHVLLFDNVDLYVRTRPGRVTSTTSLVNLTSRTLLHLPASYTSGSISVSALSPLKDAHTLEESQIVGDASFLKTSGLRFLGQELLEAVSIVQKGQKGGEKTIGLVRDYVNQKLNELRIDELAAEKWDIAPLPLVEENEGTIEGTLAVLEDSAFLLGILRHPNNNSMTAATSGSGENVTTEQNSQTRKGAASEPGPPDDVSSSSTDSAEGVAKAERTSTLRPGSVLLTCGDLKSHRNVGAGLKTRGRHEDEAERLDFYHSSWAPWHLHLNWVWTIVKVHFSSSKNGTPVSLERLRDALRRGKAALCENEPAYDEAWGLIRHVFSGWGVQKGIASWRPKDADAVAQVVDKAWATLLDGSALRKANSAHDEIGVNARLFLRHALLGLEWDEGCRRGDVGRMLAAQKFLAMAFAGAGRHQYSQACLDDIWAAHVLPADTRRTLMAARLVNRYGSRLSFIGADFFQEHQNRELQAEDISHGADSAVDRLRELFSATTELGRSMRKAHSDLLGESGRRWDADNDKRFESDIRRISELAQQDRIFRTHEETSTGASSTNHVQLGSSSRSIPSARDLLKERSTPSYGQDLLENGLLYLRKQGLTRWQNLRDASQQHDAFLFDSVQSANGDPATDVVDGQHGEEDGGSYSQLSDVRRVEIEAELRTRARNYRDLMADLILEHVDEQHNQ